MNIVCLDLEGVLIPEIWINVAKTTGVDALNLTTRDIPDYDQLMRHRLDILAQEQIKITDIQNVISQMGPLPGAVGFLDELRQDFQLAILSDTFYEFAMPLMQALGWPLLLCHRLEIAPDGAVTGYRLRQKDPKKQAVQAFKSLNYQVLAAGDSYNDTTMLLEADAGAFFKAPPQVIKEFSQLPAYETYEALLAFFRGQAT